MSSGHFMCMALPPTEMIPDWRLGRQAVEGIHGRLCRPKPSSFGPIPECLGSIGGPGAQEAVQEVQRNRTETRAKRYAQCVLGDMCAQKHMNYCMFGTSSQEAKMCPKSGRAKRYAQCHFGGMSVLKPVVLRQIRCVFLNFAIVGRIALL